jgi:2'-5' RNA ligase
MSWSSFVIDYDSFSCNLDHDNRTVYLHALPSNQTQLFAWAGLVEESLRKANVPVNHPRKSLFHMTLARVTPDYPTDKVVERLRHVSFGSHRLCSFVFDGVTIEADDAKMPPCV